jgi:hypothetical protein
MSHLLDFILVSLKPFLKGIKVTVDREAKTVTIERPGDRTVLTFDQVADRIEELFDGKA